ncbi:MAG: S41 family peptidase [Minicystis sp.]
MLPSLPTTTSGSICMPDVVVSPMGVPLPLVDLGLFATALGTLTVFNLCAPLATQKSIIPLTNGDQAGLPAMGPATITLGALKILYEKSPAGFLCCPMMGNSGNAPLGGAFIPALTNLFLNYAEEGRPAEAGSASLSALARALDPSPEDDFDAAIGDVVYKRASVFSSCLPARVYDLLRRREAAGARALILDLRCCPGGDVTSAVELAGDFLDEGAIVATVVDADEDETIYRTHQERRYAIPLVILVNRRTASAAELFAGSLKAHRRALLIGERTYGKGTVQQVAAHESGAGAHSVTVASVVLSNGDRIEGQGVEPDVEIEDGPPPPTAADFASPEAIDARLAADPVLAVALVAAAEGR